jgi:hypothetical protein
LEIVVCLRLTECPAFGMEVAVVLPILKPLDQAFGVVVVAVNLD